MISIISKRSHTYIFSGIVVVLSVVALSLWGLRLGIDFTGGTLMEVQFSAVSPSEEAVKDVILRGGGKSAVVQPSQDNAIIMRYAPTTDAD
ncbi:MAG TPA: protein translocase subunit SecF, partial [Patescibacteria group bacterium]|nr:protein translocase subunit SecF [Patescibacteria group bacterium]